MNNHASEHVKWMRRALDLARRGEGLTRPNPPVGAILVRHGRVVGQGYHRRAGGPHAEIVALRRAGRRARGGTLYVTLEPCSTWGRTPPCADAIAASGVCTVVVSMTDPNPVHAGRGFRVLRSRGLEVVTGVCRSEGAALVAPFAKWITTGRPYVTLKIAMSLDGKIADASGRSRWISGRAARTCVQGLRRRVDGILVGAGTVRLDDPSLLPRPAGGRKPWRIVVSRRGDLPAAARVLRDGMQSQTLVAMARSVPKATEARLRRIGVDVLRLPAVRSGVSLRHLLRALGKRGLLHVLCEGGAEIAASLLAAGLVDELVFFLAPAILGGADAKGAVGGAGWRLGAHPQMEFTAMAPVGSDILVRARPR